MERISPVPTTRAPAETFTGDVWFDVLCPVEGEGRMRVNTVRLSPRACREGDDTAWGDLVTDTEYDAAYDTEYDAALAQL